VPTSLLGLAFQVESIHRRSIFLVAGLHAMWMKST
jgi:hypothetical protein